MAIHRNSPRLFSLLVPFLLIGAGLSYAQEIPPPPGGGLTITILEGDNAIMDVRQRVNRETIVQVQDENHRPVAGALVAFLTPNEGPSATFVNGGHSITLTTDAQGRAVLRGMTPNKMAGKFQIRVTASQNGRTASAVITQTNVAPAGAASAGLSTKALVAIIVGSAAAAGAGIALGLHYSGGSSAAPAVVPITLQPGTAVVSAPH
jgi:hypothetical protein